MLTRISRFLTRAVIVILFFLLAAGVGSFICTFEHKSYPAAFIIAAIFVAIFYLLTRRKTDFYKSLQARDARKAGIVLSILCFVIHFIWILVLRVTPTVDFATYWAVAKALAQGEHIGLFTYVAMFPHIFGYSWFLSLFIRIFGDSSLLAPILNVILTTGSGILIYLLCLKWFSLKQAIIAYILWILCPSKAIYNTMVLSEPLYTNLFLLYLYIVTFVERNNFQGKARNIFFCAVAGFCAALVLRLMNAARPIAAVPIIALFIWVICLRQEELTEQKHWGSLLVFCAALILLYIPSGNFWDNYVADRLGQEPASFPGYSVYVGFNTDSEGSYSDEDMDLLQDYVYNQGLSPEEAQEKMLDAAKDRITSGNINFPRLLLHKLSTFLGNDEGGAYYAKEFISDNTYRIFSFLSNIYYYVIIILVSAALIADLKTANRTSFQIVLLYIIGLTLAQMLVEVAGRYHYSLLPGLIIIAVSCHPIGRKEV